MTTNLRKRSYKGIHHYRLKDTSARKEAIFAKSWRQYNEENPNFLKELLGKEPTDEQVELLSTLVQWCGTKFGFRFVDEVVKKCIGIIKTE